MELAIVLAIIGTLGLVAVVAPERPRRTRTGGAPVRATTANGIPRVILDPPAVMRHRFVRGGRSVRARGSIAPPSSSLLPANVRVGEMNVRRFATPLPAIDDGWDLIE